MDFQQSKTYANLKAAFDLERMVSTQYAINGETARREGYIEVSNIFDVVSHQERAHAVIWLQILNNGTLPTTEQNISDSLQYETLVSNNTYREYARIANEEGYNDIAALFNGVANIELIHDAKFNELLQDFTSNQVFCKPNEVLWICLNCGNVLSGNCAPAICPVCKYPQGYYQVYNSCNV